jgi:hypothetical protein
VVAPLPLDLFLYTVPLVLTCRLRGSPSSGLGGQAWATPLVLELGLALWRVWLAVHHTKTTGQTCYKISKWTKHKSILLWWVMASSYSDPKWPLVDCILSVFCHRQYEYGRYAQDEIRWSLDTTVSTFWIAGDQSSQKSLIHQDQKRVKQNGWHTCQKKQGVLESQTLVFSLATHYHIHQYVTLLKLWNIFERGNLSPISVLCLWCN